MCPKRRHMDRMLAVVLLDLGERPEHAWSHTLQIWCLDVAGVRIDLRSAYVYFARLLEYLATMV